ncbi:uncharacterized protein LOC128987463 [Macrosteles quadrilineatus]|uniref:uncharacterized protein LOC128987463 n=1 Tax=Macrosteles quadrilineatus TaxID=74068 RepID=UPI0023E2A75A|nr:uncharacterized protein LOC128987463 [Macrosteles quadrilineatus]
MSAWWICLLVVFISSVNSKFDLETPIRLAHCRASCLFKMKNTPVDDASCQKSAFCAQCWKSCSILQTTSLRDLHCRRKQCGPGCLEACKFHSPPPRPVSTAPLEEMLVVNQSRVSWPPTSGPVIYVVMTDGTQLCQTLQSSVSLPPSVDPTTVRVLVVDWRGLVKVFCPVEESPIDQTLHILRSLGMEEEIHEAHIDLDNETYLEDSTKQIRIDSSWGISLLSLHPEPSLVLAQISWKPYHNLLNISYLVSWTAEDNVVRGNMLTNTSIVTLSLWPDTTYTIQVALFSLEFPVVQSQPMVLDTRQEHNTSQPSTESHGHMDDPHPYTGVHRERHRDRGDEGVGTGEELAAGVSAAVLVFLGVVLTATWRWRHRLYLPHNKLLDEESGAPNLYRVFPPVMRLMGDSGRSSDLFSSQDNLLQHQ